MQPEMFTTVFANSSHWILFSTKRIPLAKTHTTTFTSILKLPQLLQGFQSSSFLQVLRPVLYASLFIHMHTTYPTHLIALNTEILGVQNTEQQHAQECGDPPASRHAVCARKN